MDNLAQRLTEHLTAAGIPLDGVGIGRRADRSTWRVDFTSDATDEQRATAAALIATFDPDTQLTQTEQDKAGITANLTALFTQIAARQTAIAARRTAITSDLALLPTATALQQRQILARLLQAEDDMLNAERRELDVLERIVKALRG